MIRKKKERNSSNDLNIFFLKVCLERDIVVDEQSSFLHFLQSDHKPFKKYAKERNLNLQILWFCSKKEIKYIHNYKDIVEKCSSETLDDLIEALYYSIKELDLKRNQA